MKSRSKKNRKPKGRVARTRPLDSKAPKERPTYRNPSYVDVIAIPGKRVRVQRPRGLTVPGLDDRPEARALLDAIHSALPRLKGLLAQFSNHQGYEDPVYRLYHQSWKVYYLQMSTRQIVETLRALSPIAR